MGFDAVKDSVGKGKAQLVLCAGDLSEGTRRRVGAFCEDWVEVADLPETQFALTDQQKTHRRIRRNSRACEALPQKPCCPSGQPKEETSMSVVIKYKLSDVAKDLNAPE